jgi:hypothetical protein
MLPTRLLRPALAAATVAALAGGPLFASPATPTAVATLPAATASLRSSAQTVLAPGEQLLAGQKLSNPLAGERLVVWPDGNFILYRGATTPIWNSRRNLPGATGGRLVMQLSSRRHHRPRRQTPTHLHRPRRTTRPAQHGTRQSHRAREDHHRALTQYSGTTPRSSASHDDGVRSPPDTSSCPGRPWPVHLSPRDLTSDIRLAIARR